MRACIEIRTYGKAVIANHVSKNDFAYVVDCGSHKVTHMSTMGVIVSTHDALYAHKIV